MQPFDLPNCELNGVHLIEASAGTGKTHALAGLYLRLIIEAKILPQQILVITFTNAATAELKTRVRQMLLAAKEAFQSGTSNQDELLQNLLGKYPTAPQRSAVLRQIHLTLADYDETAIHTIHGFCDRILKENAFESGMMFDAEIIANQQSLEDEFVSDFWRKTFYTNHPLIVQYALHQKFHKEKLLTILQEITARMDMVILPDKISMSPEELDDLYGRFLEEFRVFRNIWFDQRDAIIAVLKSESLNKTSYGKQVDRIKLEIDLFTAPADPEIPLPETLKKLTTDTIRRATKTKYAPPCHAIFETADELFRQASALEEKLGQYLLYLLRKFMDAAIHEFPSFKRQKNLLYFNDLLLDARSALATDRGNRLKAALREQYKAVLVDEFQDTDPVQYAILQSIFINEKEENNDMPLFYIGDPKQAIYSFRGADVFAYLEAASQTSKQYTMMTNWRSEKGLVNAVNCIFSFSDCPFIYKEIKYIWIHAAPQKERIKLLIEGEDSAAMHILFLSSEKEGANNHPLTKTVAKERIIQTIVSKIAGLLKLRFGQKAMMGQRPLQENDIAVLVRTNRQAADFQRALNKAGIPSTLQSTENIFQTDEAEEMRRFLLGIVRSDHDGMLLAALATALVGLNAESIGICLENDSILEEWRRKFQLYRECFARSGFMTMFYDFLEQEHIRSRIIARPDGNRKMTNYLHLAEEIHLAQMSEKMTLNTILRWYDSLLMRRGGILGEREQLRMENDQNAVHLVTVHRSKGLEYPIVFCPFVWESSLESAKDELFFFHDEQNKHRLTCDLRKEPPNEHLEQRRKEILAEETRLLYVALTRAKYLCYFVWGNIKDVQKSALWHLLHAKDKNSSGEENMTDEFMLEKLKHLSILAPQDIAVSIIEKTEAVSLTHSESPTEKMTCREFSGHIDLSWKIASYTYLINTQRKLPEVALRIEENDSPQQDIYPRDAVTMDNMFSFPCGTVAGSLLHEILEAVNFSQADDLSTRKIILETLRQYNFDQKWESVLSEMILKVAQMNLMNAGSDFNTDFNLASLAPGHSIKEFEFTFPVAGLSLRKVIGILKENKLISSEKQNIDIFNFNIHSIQGFLKGFIDMIFEYENRFYLLDWKSNYLGNQYDDYSRECIRNYMKHSSYVLQYLIYTLALDRYLQSRMKNYSYENHFGGVYYIFLRGINDDCKKNNGIYFDKISPELLKQVKDLFSDKKFFKSKN